MPQGVANMERLLIHTQSIKYSDVFSTDIGHKMLTEWQESIQFHN